MIQLLNENLTNFDCQFLLKKDFFRINSRILNVDGVCVGDIIII